MPRRTTHPLYLVLAGDEDARRAPYQDLFRGALDDEPLINIRLAFNQDQPVGNDHFYREIKTKTCQRREQRERGRPRKQDEQSSARDEGQDEMPH